MCGIISCITSTNESLNIINNGLNLLMNRGYDSKGISIFNKYNELECHKSLNKDHNFHIEPIPNIIIGHNRWATHGLSNLKNAHPHVSMNNLFSIVHNGIITNYLLHKDVLINEGYEFKSDTDTEVIVNLLESIYLKCNDIISYNIVHI